MVRRLCLPLLLILMCNYVAAQSSDVRTLSGVLVTQQAESLPGVAVSVSYESGDQKIVSDAEGHFRFVVPKGPLTVRVEGKHIRPREMNLGPTDPTENLSIKVEFIIPAIHESVVITADTPDPTIDRRNETIYRNTLFGRDDQLVQTLANFHGFSGSLLWRHVSNYRLDGEDASIRASGLDIVDLNVTRRLRRWVDLNFAVDNIFNKHYFETQNNFESRLRPGDPVVTRIHGTPGYPVGLTIGVTFHLSGK